MITIRIKPARRRFAGRRQWKFEIFAANNRRIDPRDTYANPGDIRAIMIELVDGGQEVQLETHGTDGRVKVERIR